ncbi:MAG: TetR/AcrR family transcriptional regulator [Myxococcales bacterium]|nr:TetR/AcrR family transcriptional regulator [Myxococcales bacterium]
MAKSNPQPKKATNSPAPAGETARQRARKDEILAAAQRILIEEGHHRLTLRNVAEKVGIKLASLQYHFPNKHDLITALMVSVDENYQGLLESLLGVIDSSATDEAAARVIERVFAEYQDERALNLHEQLWALSIRDSAMMDQYLKGYSNIWESTAEVIGRFDPAATEDERRTRAALLIALVDGLETFLSAEQLRRRLPDSIKTSFSELIKTIARG